MVFLLVPVIAVLGITVGKIILGRWINHLSIYCVIWTVLICLYELKLLPYVDVSLKTWFYIGAAFLSFLLGIVTITSARSRFQNPSVFSKKFSINSSIFADGGKTVRYAVLIFSIISIYAGVQNWMILIKLFGSIPAVFLNANKVYVLNSQGGGVKGVVPFISVFGYVAVFFAGIYTAYRGRFSFLSFLPFVGVIIKQLAIEGRAGMLFALLEFLFTFILFRHLLKEEPSRQFKFSKTNAIISFIILIAFFVASASLVRLARGGSESYMGANTGLNRYKKNIIITPTLYLYLSSDVGVLSKYFDSGGENTEFGQNTFLTVYHVLSKLGLLKRPSDYQRGYYIPMWTNTGTYIRELDADFGVSGAFLGPYLIGLLATWLWFKVFERKSLYAMIFLVYLYLIIGFSFLVMITRVSTWSISQGLVLLCIPFLERISVNKSERLKYKTANK